MAARIDRKSSGTSSLVTSSCSRFSAIETGSCCADDLKLFKVGLDAFSNDDLRPMPIGSESIEWVVGAIIFIYPAKQCVLEGGQSSRNHAIVQKFHSWEQSYNKMVSNAIYVGVLMNFTSAVAPELPFLRRYARAVTGSQTLGDVAVGQALKAILEAPGIFDSQQPARVELYRIFHIILNPASADLVSGSAINDLDILGRQSLLLTAVEGFNITETAQILDTTPEIVAQNLDAAKQAISAMLRSRIMIIEDEAVIALHIQAIVKEVGHDVIGIARTQDQAVKMAKDLQPELVLADISLADGSSGIDAARDILDVFDIPVIFVTAFPERLLTGERPEPTYLITKPFEPIMLTATIAQALMLDREKKALAVD